MLPDTKMSNDICVLSVIDCITVSGSNQAYILVHEKFSTNLHVW